MCSCSTSKPTQPAVLSFRFSTKVDPKFSTSSKIYRVTSPLDQLLKFLKLVSRGFIMLTFAKVLVLIMVHLLCQKPPSYAYLYSNKKIYMIFCSSWKSTSDHLHNKKIKIKNQRKNRKQKTKSNNAYAYIYLNLILVKGINDSILDLNIIQVLHRIFQAQRSLLWKEQNAIFLHRIFQRTSCLFKIVEVFVF